MSAAHLLVWWIPQIPGKPFHVPVSTPAEAQKLLTVLADYDIFQLENNIKPDYCNAGGLEEFQNGEWAEWSDDNGDSIDDAETIDIARATSQPEGGA